MTGPTNRTPMVRKANMIPANRLPPPAHFHAASDRMQQIRGQLSHIRQAIETVCKTLDDRFEQQEKRERLLDRKRAYQQFWTDMRNIGIEPNRGN
jgi:hypothetical protein